jgi:hypothetical protein
VYAVETDAIIIETDIPAATVVATRVAEIHAIAAAIADAAPVSGAVHVEIYPAVFLSAADVEVLRKSAAGI